MRVSHICHACGFDMVREAAPPDPVYGLRIVRCRCGLCHVRQPENHRTLMRPILAYTRLALRMIALAVAVGIPCVSLVAAGAELWSRTIRGEAFATNLGLVLDKDVDVLVVCGLLTLFSSGMAAWLLWYRSCVTRTITFGALSLLTSLLTAIAEAEGRGTLINPDRLLRALAVLLPWSVLVTAVFAATSVGMLGLSRLGVFRTRFSTRLARARRKRR